MTSPARIPTWRRKTDEELREIVRGVWEGEILGTWQLENLRELDTVFPGYYGFWTMAGFTHPESALSFARAPFPAGAYGRRPERPRERRSDPRWNELPVFADWEVLSWEEWERVRAMLGYPPRKPRKPPEPEAGEP